MLRRMALPLLILLAGCSSIGSAPAATPAPTVTLAPVCAKPGTVEWMVLDSPTQGYD